MEDFEEKIKQSFNRVKRDFESINEKIIKLEERLTRQEQHLDEALKKIDKILMDSKQTNNTLPEEDLSDIIPKQLSEQAFKRASEHLSASDFKDKNEDLSCIDDKYAISTGNDGAKRLSAELSVQLSTKRASERALSEQASVILNKDLGDLSLEEIKNKVDLIFFKLSKQELKVFLLVYQLEDENIPPTTRILSEKMQLSESCTRAYLSSLFGKNAPIERFKVNNRTNIFTIKKDFRVLNLKKRLIDLFYHKNTQKTLFNF